MKTLAFIIQDKEDATYEELLSLVRKEDPEINQLLISIDSGKVYCYKDEQKENSIVA